MVDLPGHGASNMDYFPFESIKDIAVHVQTVADKLELSQFDVVGHSMGGYVGLELKQIDDRCEKLVLLNSNFWSDSELKKLDRQRVAELVINHSKHFIREAIPNLFYKSAEIAQEIHYLITEASEMRPEAIAQSSIAMSRRQDFSNQLDKLGSDLYIIQGEFDSTVPLQSMIERINDSSLDVKVIPNVGHMAHLENRVEVSEALSSILK